MQVTKVLKLKKATKEEEKINLHFKRRLEDINTLKDVQKKALNVFLNATKQLVEMGVGVELN